MDDIKIPEFSYYNQKGELITKGSYSISREQGPYINNLLDQYTEGHVFGSKEDPKKESNDENE